MNRREAITVMLPFATCVGLLGGCVVDPQGPDTAAQQSLPPALQAQSVAVNNDAAALASRIRLVQRPLFVRANDRTRNEVVDPGKAGVGAVRLTLVGEIDPPTVDGFVVQANDIDILGDRAVVAYNFAGDVFKGAVQLIDFSHPDRPQMLSEVLYSDADVNAVALEGTHLYVGLASGDPTLATPALVTELSLAGLGLERSTLWTSLPSWAVTDLAVQGNQLVASVGADLGGVALLERNLLRMTRFAELPDARGVTVDAGQTVLAVSGTDAYVCTYLTPGLDLQSRVEVTGYRTAYAKGTIEMTGRYCFLGAGEGGFQVRDTAGALLAALNGGDFSAERADLVVANAATAANRLGFVAAGALGVQVVSLGRYSEVDETTAGAGDGGDLWVLGELDFEASVSSNMVKAKNDLLVVAAGLGGVKLVKMQGAN